MIEPAASRPHLYGMLPEDLGLLLRAHGQDLDAGEARRILAHGVSLGRAGFPHRRPVARVVAQAVESLVDRRPLHVVERAADPDDGFVKYLFRLVDGALVEAVRIPLERAGRFTVCISTQVGCAMRCQFCATGRLGLTRNLLPWEMVAQFLAVRDEAPGRACGVLFQGQGEPLGNLDATLRAAAILAHPCGGRVRAEAITISTVGLVPGILRLARERKRYRLVVSLSSAIDARRRQLLPVVAACPVADLFEAIRSYQRAVGGRVTIAWVVLGGVNTGPDEVEALAPLLRDLPVRFNIIDVNPSPGDGFRRATPEELAAFRDRLQVLRMPIVRRYSGGVARHAGCGMLAAIRTQNQA